MVVTALASDNFADGYFPHTPVDFVLWFENLLHSVKRKQAVPVGIHEMLNTGQNCPVPRAVKVLGGL
jgi:hypothetical protein